MNHEDLAIKTTFSRLHSPVPVLKLLVCHKLGTLLDDEATRDQCFRALLELLRDARFETEITDALVVPLIARKSTVDVAALRTSINYPWVLSDLMLSLIAGQPFLVDSWRAAHSGIAPRFHSLESVKILRKAQIIPPFVAHRLEGMDQRFGYPFVRQWCFEFDALAARSREQGASQFMHFTEGDPQRQIGQFSSLPGHRARSAYLRTLALAVDQWAMPSEYAQNLADAVKPVDTHFVGFVPTRPPEWSTSLGQVRSVDLEEWSVTIAKATSDSATQYNRVVLHADAFVGGDKLYAAQLELTTAFCNDVAPAADEVFHLHDQLLGKSSYGDLDAASLGTISEPPLSNTFELAVIPLVSEYLGLFYANLMWRAHTLLGYSGSLASSERE